MTAVTRSDLPLPLFRRGKVREVYEVGSDRLLLVASDRVSAFDVVMTEPIPRKGAVLTQLSAFWFGRMASLGPTHFLTADADAIIAEVLAAGRTPGRLAQRAMLVRRTEPIPFECVIRGYPRARRGEYRRSGTLAMSRCHGLVESDPFPAPIFSPHIKAESGHDINVTRDAVAAALGADRVAELERRSLAIYAAWPGLRYWDHHRRHQVRIRDRSGRRTAADRRGPHPGSSRFWPTDRYERGRSQPSFDKQPLRDYLQSLHDAGRWNMESPGPTLPPEVIDATSRRYLEAFRLLTGADLPEAGA
ncbi:MAG: phosphoribosylaminoimidazolesuccinocarboxamide synthase [Gemmatimonadales bacterium]